MTIEIGDDGFVVIPNPVWKALPNPLALYALLRYRANNETGQSWYAQNAMADDLGVGRATIQRWLSTLQNLGFVTIKERVNDDGIQTSNIYTVIGVLGASDVMQPGDSEMMHELLNIDSLDNESLSMYESSCINNDAPSKTESPDRFDEFWTAYPRKVAKIAARKAWAKAITVASPDSIIAGACQFGADPNLPDEQFIPHPSTWLNAGQWEDGPLPAQSNRTRGERQISADQARQERLASLSLTQRRAIQ